MSIELATKYAAKAQEIFITESKTGLLTNQDYDWTGAHSVKIYKISTAKMNDYNRAGNDDGNPSRYGKISDLNATTQEAILSKDRSFIFNVDKLDEDETAGALNAQTCLARQIREVVNPERDRYIYSVLADGAGIKPDPAAKEGFKYYDAILEATAAMDDAEVPDTERVLVLPPAGYAALKKELIHPAYGTLSEQERAAGVIAQLDGMTVVKVATSYLPDNTAFMIVHPSACVAPVKLDDCGVHEDTPLSSGALVTGRFAYDAFVLDNKKTGIYYQAFKEEKAASTKA